MSGNFLHRLRVASMKKLPRPPQNYLTTQQWAQKWGKSRPTVQSIVLQAIHLKLMKRKDFVILVNGSPRPVPHYCQVR